MVIYIEYALLDNLIIDFILLKTSSYFCNKSIKNYRIILSSLLGAIFAIVFPLINAHTVILSAIKMLFGFVITFTVAKYKSFFEYIKLTKMFFSSTFFVGGVLTGLYNMLEISLDNNLILSFTVLFIFLICKFAKKVVFTINRTKLHGNFLYKIKIKVVNCSFNLVGFLDSGNEAYYGDSPLIFINKKVYKNILNRVDVFNLRQNKIDIYTINGNSENISFRIDQLVIYFGERENRYNNVAVAVCDLNNSYDVILHPALFRIGGEYEEVIGYNKKVC